MWLHDEECGEIVKNGWNSMQNAELKKFTKNLMELQMKLKRWNRRKYHKLPNKIKETMEVIEMMVSKQTKGKELKVAKDKLNHYFQAKEKYWRARSRSNWIKQGDRSTRYFHHHAI